MFLSFWLRWFVCKFAVIFRERNFKGKVTDVSHVRITPEGLGFFTVGDS